MKNLDDLKQQYKAEFDDLKQKGIIETDNAEFLKTLADRAKSTQELIKIKALGTKYQRTGFHFDVKFEISGDNTIKFFKRNDTLSFMGGGNRHKLIIGDNYNALNNLLITHKNKIKVIYIDPPYGKDSMGAYAQTNYTNAIKRDNLLTMLYTRLSLAKELLSDDGVIFCSIDDRNQAYVKCLFDEVFGEANFLYMLSVVNNLNGNDNSSGMIETQEYCLFYAKNKNLFEVGVLPVEDEESSDWQVDELGYWKLGGSLKATGINAPKEARPNLFFPIWINEETLDFSIEEQAGTGWYYLIPLTDGKEMSWYWSKEKFKRDKDEVIVKRLGTAIVCIKNKDRNLEICLQKEQKQLFIAQNMLVQIATKS